MNESYISVVSKNPAIADKIANFIQDHYDVRLEKVSDTEIRVFFEEGSKIEEDFTMSDEILEHTCETISGAIGYDVVPENFEF